MTDATKNYRIIIFVYGLILFIGLLISIFYQIRNYRSRTVTFFVFWLDFFYIYIIFLAYITLRFLLLKEESDDDDTNIKIRKIKLILSLLLSAQFIMNSIKSLILIKQIKDFMKIKINYTKSTELEKFLRRFNPIKIYSVKYHIIIFAITICLVMGPTLPLIILKKYDCFKYLNSVIGFAFLAFELICLRVLSSKYKKLVKLGFKTDNFINERIYDKTKIKIFTIIEQFLYKAYYDFLINVPVLVSFVFVISKKETNFYIYGSNTNKFQYNFILIFDLILFYSYFVLLGSLNLSIDKENDCKPSKLMNCFFLSFMFKYTFYSKSKTVRLFNKKGHDSIKDDIISSLPNKPEGNLLFEGMGNDLKQNEKQNVKGKSESSVKTNNLSKLSRSLLLSSRTEKSINDSDASHGTSSLEMSDFQIAYQAHMDYLPCTFYIIYKILYLFFKSNENIFLKMEKNIEKEGIPFKYCNNNFMIDKEKNSLKSSTISSNSKDLLDSINKLNRLSVTNHDKMKVFQNYSLNTMMHSINDKYYKEEFINKFIIERQNQLNPNDLKKMASSKQVLLTNTSKYNSTQFKIEAINNNILFELFPFYQITINDLLRSLEVNSNKELFEQYYEKKKSDESFNSFSTKDGFLSFEMYDIDFLPYKKLKEFMQSYKDYLLEKIRNFTYTYLPLIIGVYNISYLDYNKIVIMYRNPISFSSFINFHVWINYSMSENTDKVTTSTKNSTITNVSEIEVENNLNLKNEDFNETVSILKSDLKFLKKQPFELNMKINLFVINDINQPEKNSLSEDRSSNAINDKDILTKDEQFERALGETIIFINENTVENVKKFKKYYGSDVLSLFEKLQSTCIGKNIYLFKIYFSELFCNRKKSIDTGISSNPSIQKENSENKNQINNEDEETSIENIIKKNKLCCKLLKLKLLKKISKEEETDIFNVKISINKNE